MLRREVATEVRSFLLALAFAGSAAAATVHDFDHPGTPYTVNHAAYGSNPELPVILDGGPTGKFLRIAERPAVNLNTIAFGRTDSAVNEITADFDFRMTPPPEGRSSAADGLGFALLNCANWGPNGGVHSDTPELPLLLGSLGVGFKIYNTSSVIVTFNGSQIVVVDVSSVVDLANAQFIHARIVMRPEFSDITVILTPPGGTPTTVIDEYVVPGFTPYVGRAWFGARSGGLSADYDLDNINLQFTGALPEPPFLTLLKTPGIRFASYQPTNFNPNRAPPGGPLIETPTPDSITRDLVVLRPAFNGLILYGTQTDDIGDGKQLVPWVVEEALRLGYRAIVLTVWDPKNDAEVDAAAALVNEHGADPNAFAVAVCIGNEGIQNDDYTIADLDAARSRLLQQAGTIEVPVVTSEDYARYSIVPQLQAWGTFLFPILVPHWNVPELGPVAAAEWVRDTAAALADSAQLTVFVKEPAWPSAGEPEYTPETQRQFFEAYLNGPQYVQSEIHAGVFTAYNSVLEAFDQEWKNSPDFTTWGLLESDRMAKSAYNLFLFPFSDASLIAGASFIRAAHVIELRRRIDALRVRHALAPFAWTDGTIMPQTTLIRAAHVLDMRTGLAQVYVQRGEMPPAYTDPSLAGANVKAVHMTQLRTAVTGIE